MNNDCVNLKSKICSNWTMHAQVNLNQDDKRIAIHVIFDLVRKRAIKKTRGGGGN